METLITAAMKEVFMIAVPAFVRSSDPDHFDRIMNRIEARKVKESKEENERRQCI